MPAAGVFRSLRWRSRLASSRRRSCARNRRPAGICSVSERTTLHWLMATAAPQLAWQRCLAASSAADSMLLLGPAVLLLLQPELEAQLTQRHVVACAEHWQQQTGAAAPDLAELVTWPQIVQLIQRHPLQRSWT